MKCTNKDGQPLVVMQFDSNTSTFVLPRGIHWGLVTRRLAYDAQSGVLLQDLKNPQTCSELDLFGKVPVSVKVLHTVFHYRHGGTPWHRHVHLQVAERS